MATRYLVLAVDPLGSLVLRFALCSLCYLPLAPFLNLSRWTPRHRWLLLACGLVGILGYNVPMTLGIRDVQAGFAGILLATEPLWIALLSVLVLKQKLTAPLVCGLAVAFAGVITLSAGGGVAVDGSMLGGAALVLLGAFMWGAYSVAVGPLVRRYGALRVSAMTMWIGTIPMVAFALWRALGAGQDLTTTGWVVLCLYALGPNLLGMLAWNYGLSRVPSTRAGLMLNLYPVVSVVGGYLFLDEPVTTAAVLGGGLVIAGLVLSRIDFRRSPAPRPGR